MEIEWSCIQVWVHENIEAHFSFCVNAGAAQRKTRMGQRARERIRYSQCLYGTIWLQFDAYAQIVSAEILLHGFPVNAALEPWVYVRSHRAFRRLRTFRRCTASFKCCWIRSSSRNGMIFILSYVHNIDHVCPYSELSWLKIHCTKSIAHRVYCLLFNVYAPAYYLCIFHAVSGAGGCWRRLRRNVFVSCELHMERCFSSGWYGAFLGQYLHIVHAHTHNWLYLQVNYHSHHKSNRNLDTGPHIQLAAEYAPPSHSEKAR